MTDPRANGRRAIWGVAALVLLLVAVVCFVAGAPGDGVPTASPGDADPIAGSRAPTGALSQAPPAVSEAVLDAVPAPPAGTAEVPPGAARPGATDPAAPPPVASSGGARSPAPTQSRSAPVALRIPAINVSVGLSELGLNPDRTVEVPGDFQQPGWFRLGPTPGEVGSAVILGHVDSYRGPAVFFRLGSLRPGNRIEVDLVNGDVVSFVVDSVQTHRKDQFPARQVYGSRGVSALQLVTCGGEFDARARSYLSNVVVYTSFVGTSRPEQLR